MDNTGVLVAEGILSLHSLKQILKLSVHSLDDICQLFLRPRDQNLLVILPVLCEGFDRVHVVSKLPRRHLLNSLTIAWVEEKLSHRHYFKITWPILVLFPNRGLGVLLVHEVLKVVMGLATNCFLQILYRPTDCSSSSHKDIMNPIRVLCWDRRDLALGVPLCQLLKARLLLL